jgi:putative NADH-flavin reductase
MDVNEHERLFNITLRYFIIPGGATLYIETVLKKTYDPAATDPGSLETTGNLGNVMKESIQLAYTFVSPIQAFRNPYDSDGPLIFSSHTIGSYDVAVGVYGLKIPRRLLR